MLYYVPIEPYKTRYTADWIDQFERVFKAENLSFQTVLGVSVSDTVTTGGVLDTCGTHIYKFSQLETLMHLIKDGRIKDNDVIFFADLWFPGLESLFYVRNMTGIKFKIAGIFHAGTYDFADFTYRSGMRDWGVGLENSWFTGIDTIFLATESHKKMLLENSIQCIGLEDKIYVTGLPFYAQELADKYLADKEDILVFPHRLDPEKHPEMFNELVGYLIMEGVNVKPVFTIRSTNSREEYFKLLGRSKVMVSFADQETFGYSTLESMALSNIVVVPNKLSYVETVPEQYRYNTKEQAFEMVKNALVNYTKPEYNLDKWKYSIQNMLQQLGELQTGVVDATQYAIPQTSIVTEPEQKQEQVELEIPLSVENESEQIAEPEPEQIAEPVDIFNIPVIQHINKPLFGAVDNTDDTIDIPKEKTVIDVQKYLEGKPKFNPDTGFHLYFAGQQAPDMDVYMQARNALRLFSQVNERKGIAEWVASGYSDRLFIDSGAFSVAHAGKEVDIDQYIEYINSNPDISIFAELDEIPYPVLNKDTATQSAEVSWKNYLYMKERVTTNCHLLPLYHFGESKDALRRILNTEVNGKLPEYIGIGGRHGVPMDVQCKYFNEIFAIVQKSNNPNVKIHVFGMTVLPVLEQFPFYSADSTTWLQSGINGFIKTENYGMVTVSDRTRHAKDNIYNFSKEAQDAIHAEVEAKGYKLEDLATNYKARLFYNIDHMLDWAMHYQYKGPKTFISKSLF